MRGTVSNVSDIEALNKLLNIIASSEEGEEKIAAAQEILKHERDPDYLIKLTELVLDPNHPAGVRTVASTKMKEFVKLHWCSKAEGFLPPEIGEDMKTQIKKLLPPGLGESHKKLRETVADVMSSITLLEWPGDWMNLLSTLTKLWHGESEFGILGGLRVLKGFVTKIATNHYFGGLVLGEMLYIFRTDNKYSVESRCMACEIFSKFVLETVMYENPREIELSLHCEVLMFSESSILRWKSQKHDDDVKISILKMFTMLLNNLPKYVSNPLTKLIPLVWETLIDCSLDYEAKIVNLCVGVDTAENSVRLTEAILDFIENLMNGQHRYAPSINDFNLLDHEWFWLQDNFIPPHALGFLIMLMRITDEQIRLWNNDVIHFVKQREQDNVHGMDGIGKKAKILISVIAAHRERGIANSMILEIMKHLADRIKVHDDDDKDDSSTCQMNPWKIQEAFLKAFCLMRPTIVWKNARDLCYDIEPCFRIVLGHLKNPESNPFLVGRCLCLGGLYAAQVPPEMAPAFLKYTIKSLRSDKPACERICAAKAVYLWYDRDDSSKGNRHEDVLRSRVPVLFHKLSNLAESLMSAEVLMLVLKSIASLMPFDKTFAASMESRIYSLAVTALTEYRRQLEDFQPWLNVFKELTLNPQCVESLQQRLTPLLLLMIDVRPFEAGIALDIVQVLVQYSPLPLSNRLIDTLFPAVPHHIMNTKHFSNNRRGIEVLHTYLSVSPQQIIGYKDEAGKTGVQYIMQSSIWILNSEISVSLVAETCKVLISLIKVTGCKLGENVDELLKALLTHARKSNYTTRGSRQILMVYAYLIGMRFKTVFNFFFRAPSTSRQQSALECIISKGFCRKYSYFDVEDQKTIKLALGKMLKYGVSNLSSRLHTLTYQVNAKTSVPLSIAICRLMTVNNES